MQVAVTLTDEAGLAPPFEHLRGAIQLATRVISHAIRCRRNRARLAELGESGGVLFTNQDIPSLRRDPGDARRTCESRLAAANGGA